MPIRYGDIFFPKCHK
jgi:hypothetical protein